MHIANGHNDSHSKTLSIIAEFFDNMEQSARLDKNYIQERSYDIYTFIILHSCYCLFDAFLRGEPNSRKQGWRSQVA